MPFQEAFQLTKSLNLPSGIFFSLLTLTRLKYFTHLFTFLLRRGRARRFPKWARCSAPSSFPFQARSSAYLNIWWNVFDKSLSLKLTSTGSTISLWCFWFYQKWQSNVLYIWKQELVLIAKIHHLIYVKHQLMSADPFPVVKDEPK